MRSLMVIVLCVFCGFTPVASAVYDPGTGRWLTRDPLVIASAGSALTRIGQSNQLPDRTDFANAYGYVGGNPVGYLDSQGLQRHVVALEGWGVAIGLGGPFVDSSSILADDVRGLVDQANWHYFDWTQAGRAADKVREIKSRRNSDCSYDTVIVMGFSNGGDRAFDVTKWVSGQADVDLLFMIDPVPAGVFEGLGSLLFGRTYQRPSNALRAVNIYQRARDPKGWPMSGADVNEKVSKSDLASFIDDNGYTGTFLYHSVMPVYTRTRQLWRSWVGSVPETIR